MIKKILFVTAFILLNTNLAASTTKEIKRSPAQLKSLYVLPHRDLALHGCKIIRATPADNTKNIYINPQITVQAIQADHQDCSQVVLRDAEGKTVAMRQILTDQWKSPIDGSVRSTTFEPIKDLQEHSNYSLELNKVTIARFATGEKNSRRGSLVSVQDIAANFADLPKTHLLTPDVINHSLRGLLKSLTKQSNPIIIDALEILARFEAPNVANPKARYNVHIQTLTYRSTQADGTPTILSGLLVYPEKTNGLLANDEPLRFFIDQHGSQGSNTPAPSSASTLELYIGALIAGKGQHIYLAPDRIGLGHSKDLPIAYLVKQDAASNTLDMFLAVSELFEKNMHAKLSKQIYLGGGSQGAFASLASLPFLSQIADIRAFYTVDGPYNIEQTVTSDMAVFAGQKRDDYSAYSDTELFSSHFNSIFNAYSAYQDLKIARNEVFDSSGQLRPEFGEKYITSFYPDLNFQLLINSQPPSTLRFNTGNADYFLWHYSKDTLVPSANVKDLLAFLKMPGHKIKSATRANCYEHSLFNAVFLKLLDSKFKTHLVCDIFYVDGLMKHLSENIKRKKAISKKLT